MPSRLAGAVVRRFSTWKICDGQTDVHDSIRGSPFGPETTRQPEGGWGEQMTWRGLGSGIVPLVLLLVETFPRRIGCDRTELDQDRNIISFQKKHTPSLIVKPALTSSYVRKFTTVTCTVSGTKSRRCAESKSHDTTCHYHEEKERLFALSHIRPVGLSTMLP